MKFKSVIIVIAFLVLNSCILKSLHPFYTKDSISFQQKFIGEWKDNKEGIWSVKSFHNIFNKEFNLKKTPSKEEQKELEKYKDSYIIEYLKSASNI